ncbi:unnamed protein product [Rotaria sp. Silwood2]|nr:unnamed protein product [Rotaria sp. Silwood2]CAF3388741.1 unnamed protein product [Rotaria sp. Silwood2]CAF4291107.1 unnamed protein product [Rotaria sp. Silwood2]CAF4336509.1 unnamed protein product [Rotaria sp. Silwood2]CAF4376713.1 unnamed protein product [Rotaria sp. Silwood2]
MDRTEHITSSKIEQGNKQFISPSSPIKNIDLNATNTPDSPEPHGIGKSPLISMMPSGTKRSEKHKVETRTDQTNTRSISSNSTIQQQHSFKNIFCFMTEKF